MARFPASFVWGAASSAYQIEGGVREGGRGPRVYLKNLQHCSILLKSDVCYVTQPCKTAYFCGFVPCIRHFVANYPALLLFQIHPGNWDEFSHPPGKIARSRNAARLAHRDAGAPQAGNPQRFATLKAVQKNGSVTEPQGMELLPVKKARACAILREIVRREALVSTDRGIAKNICYASKISFPSGPSGDWLET